VQLIGCADDINIMGRMKRAVSEVCEELKGRTKEVVLNIRVEKIFAVVQTRRTKRISEIFKIKDHGVEFVRSFKYLGTLINNTNDTRYKIKTRILAANKAYSSLQTIFRSKQINCNNTIRLYETLIKPVPYYGSVTSTVIQKREQMLYTLETKILRRIYGPIQNKRRWRSRWNSEIYNLYKDIKSED